MKSYIVLALLGIFMMQAPSAHAGEARDGFVRAEAQVKALNAADAHAAAPANYAEALLRLSEARIADEKNREEETLWRSGEAVIQAEIVQEKIKLRGLDRTVFEIETGLSTLRRELK